MNEAENKLLGRRKFLSRLSIGFGAAAAAVVAVPVFSALLGPLLKKKKEQWRKVGFVKDFPVGSVNLVVFENADPEAWAGVTAHTAAWLRRDDENNFTAFAVNCSHLGCAVRWEASAELFLCPCHGGVYYKDGSVAAGPPQRPLSTYRSRIQNEEVQVLTAPVPLTNIANKEK